jgi:hypothetical protein
VIAGKTHYQQASLRYRDIVGLKAGEALVGRWGREGVMYRRLEMSLRIGDERSVTVEDCFQIKVD